MTRLVSKAHVAGQNHLSAEIAIKLLPIALVLGAMCFNFALCFISTNIVTIKPSVVILSEMVIVSLAFGASLRLLNQKYFVIIAATILYILILSVVRLIVSPENGFDIKIVRDFLIPIAFFMLGQNVKDLRLVDVSIKWTSVVVLAFAAFEYFSLATYLKYFDVIGYYIARGTVAESKQSFLAASGLMYNGLRPQGQGRALLPFLGDYRVSSIFLEPISFGYFGVILILWGCVRSQIRGKLQLFPLMVGLTSIVLSDSRFGAYFCLLAVMLFLMPTNLTTIVVSVIPVIMVYALLLIPEFINYVPAYMENSFSGRMMYSSQVLSNFDAWNWLGFKASSMQTFDSGYSYVFSGIGLAGFAAFWIAFLAIKGRSTYFYAFRNSAAAYFAIALCIGEAQFSIKTASLLWFLMGALATTPVPEPQTANARLAHRGHTRFFKFRSVRGTSPSMNR
jgi:putative polymerase